jgi:hypothetical protein
MRKPCNDDTATHNRIASRAMNDVSVALPLRCGFIEFLGLKATCDIPWDRLHQYPTLGEVEQLSHCRCALDPMVMCPVHLCKCNKCTKGPGTQCSWRSLHTTYIAEKNKFKKVINVERESGKITYCQLLDLVNIPAPPSARERNLLNIMSYIDETSPALSDLVLDLSQSLGRTAERVDGCMFTVGTSSKIWIMKLACEMHPKHLSVLCGFPSFINWGNQTINRVNSMLGNSMHVSDVGMCLGLAICMTLGVLPDKTKLENTHVMDGYQY